MSNTQTREFKIVRTSTLPLRVEPGEADDEGIEPVH
jgi:hypothetical protein